MGMGKLEKDGRFFHQELHVNLPSPVQKFFRKCHHPLIVFYLNYLNIFCLSPFWIKWDPQKGQYVNVSGLYRKVACFFVLLWQVVWEIAKFIHPPNPLMKMSQLIEEIVGMFKLVTNLSMMPVPWLIMWIMWFRMGKVVKWINAIQGNSSSVSTFMVRFLNEVFFCVKNWLQQ